MPRFLSLFLSLFLFFAFALALTLSNGRQISIRHLNVQLRSNINSLNERTRTNKQQQYHRQLQTETKIGQLLFYRLTDERGTWQICFAIHGFISFHFAFRSVFVTSIFHLYFSSTLWLLFSYDGFTLLIQFYRSLLINGIIKLLNLFDCVYPLCDEMRLYNDSLGIKTTHAICRLTRDKNSVAISIELTYTKFITNFTSQLNNNHSNTVIILLLVF